MTFTKDEYVLGNYFAVEAEEAEAEEVGYVLGDYFAPEAEEA
jgi:hypothetical protein